jgi:DNA-binding LacI/PurR family transcriptional regulator
MKPPAGIVPRVEQPPPSSGFSLKLPDRATLSTQIASAMKEAMANGLWTEVLPSERRLSEMFEVSRPTVRAAVRELARAGLIKQRLRRNNTIACGATPVTRSRLVLVVTTEPLSRLAPESYYGICELMTHLIKHGFTTEVFVCKGRDETQCDKLRSFVRTNQVFCCLLVSVGSTLQNWCAQQNIPALVLGHTTSRLPSYDIDYRAVSRHASQLLVNNGHRRLALVVGSSQGGDLASAVGFLEGAQNGVHGQEVDATVVRHNGTSSGIEAKLRVLFRSASPPTALFVAKAQDAIVVLVSLLRQRIAVPQTVSIIARDQDPVLSAVSPRIAHYYFDQGAFSSTLTQLMLRMTTRGTLPPKPYLLFPKFLPGDTVGRGGMRSGGKRMPAANPGQ